MKFVKIAAIVTIFFLATSVLAHEEMQAPEDVIKTIMARQGVTDMSQLDCAKISGGDFEFLGDSIMERMAGSHELHEQMDNMMGGEGSASLKQMHITMGKNWLACHEGMDMGGMMTSMTPMMMRMMGSYYPAYYSGFDAVLIFGVIGWILFIAALVYLLLTRQVKRSRK